MEQILRKIWICGATGFCGTGVIQTILSQNHLLTALQAQKDQVFAHLRKDSPHAQQFDQKPEWQNAIACHELMIVKENWDEKLEAVFEEVQPDVVFCALGTTQKRAKREKTSYETIDRDLTLKILAMCEKQAKTAKAPLVIYVSAMGIEWARWSRYLQMRADVEKAIIASGLPYVILRPGFLTGPTRDDFRLVEKIGGQLSESLADLFHIAGLDRAANQSRPISAEIMGGAVWQILHGNSMTETIANSATDPATDPATAAQTPKPALHLCLESAQIHETYQTFMQKR